MRLWMSKQHPPPPWKPPYRPSPSATIIYSLPNGLKMLSNVQIFLKKFFVKAIKWYLEAEQLVGKFCFFINLKIVVGENGGNIQYVERWRKQNTHTMSCWNINVQFLLIYKNNVERGNILYTFLCVLCAFILLLYTFALSDLSMWCWMIPCSPKVPITRNNVSVNFVRWLSGTTEPWSTISMLY